MSKQYGCKEIKKEMSFGWMMSKQYGCKEIKKRDVVWMDDVKAVWM